MRFDSKKLSEQKHMLQLQASINRAEWSNLYQETVPGSKSLKLVRFVLPWLVKYNSMGWVKWLPVVWSMYAKFSQTRVPALSRRFKIRTILMLTSLATTVGLGAWAYRWWHNRPFSKNSNKIRFRG